MSGSSDTSSKNVTKLPGATDRVPIHETNLRELRKGQLIKMLRNTSQELQQAQAMNARAYAALQQQGTRIQWLRRVASLLLHRLGRDLVVQATEFEDINQTEFVATPQGEKGLRLELKDPPPKEENEVTAESQGVPGTIDGKPTADDQETEGARSGGSAGGS